MVTLVQLVRMPRCGRGGPQFKSEMLPVHLDILEGSHSGYCRGLENLRYFGPRGFESHTFRRVGNVGWQSRNKNSRLV